MKVIFLADSGSGFYSKKIFLILSGIIFFRSTQKNISQVSKGFFEDPRHLANHFQYLSESPALDIMIRENLDKNLGSFFCMLS